MAGRHPVGRRQVDDDAHGQHPRAARRDLYGRIFEDWPERDRRTLADLMHRLNESLDRHTRKP